MEKINHSLIRFAKYYSPVIVVAVILDHFGYNVAEGSKSFVNYVFDILGWIGIGWCCVVFYLFFALVFNEKLKNTFVRWLAGIQENDERESYLTGLASKKTFISVTATLVLLLFLSALHVTVYRIRDAKENDNKHGAIALGMGLSIIKDESAEMPKDDPDRIYLVNYKGLPLTADGTLLLVMILQMGIFYFYSRREQRALNT